MNTTKKPLTIDERLLQEQLDDAAAAKKATEAKRAKARGMRKRAERGTRKK